MGIGEEQITHKRGVTNGQQTYFKKIQKTLYLQAKTDKAFYTMEINKNL